MEKFDIVIIGAGIIGAATASKLIQRFGQRKILLLEKEDGAARHQTGRNSGVIHAGVYYQPDSLKAKYCRQGLAETIQFCQQYQLPYLQCGKLIVATNELEVSRLAALYQRSQDNHLSVSMLNGAQLKQQEPNISGIEAMYVKETGITDYTAITNKMIELFVAAGGRIAFSSAIKNIEESDVGCTLRLGSGETVVTDLLINCSGLHSDRVIKQVGLEVDFTIVPFRGEYYRLPKQFNSVVNHLIYPVPDPSLPFLGVHLTRMIDGSVTVGPNAVLAFAREGYHFNDVNLQDLFETMTYQGFWRLMAKHMTNGIREMKNSLYKPGYLQLVQKYCPQIKSQHLLPYRSGVRAQAVDKEGNLIHDFKFVESAKTLHVGNAPSPAATSALPIADEIIRRVESKLG